MVMFWCRDNKLSINLVKTKAMIFSPRVNENLHTKEIGIEEQSIAVAHEDNYFGMKVDKKLKL